MPRRETGTFIRLLSEVSSNVATTEAQREPHAQFWDTWNTEAVNADGPLWVALGDSTSQGMGSPDPLKSWIPLVLDRLRASTGDPWRVVNLGITGAQFSDVIEHQLPRVEQLRSNGQEPALMSFLVGTNNLLAPASWPKATAELDVILNALAPRSIVARVGVHHAGNTLMARKLNRTIEAIAAEKQFELFWPWKWPSLDGMGDDKWHPGPKGYEYMTDTIYERIQASLTLDRI